MWWNKTENENNPNVIYILIYNVIIYKHNNLLEFEIITLNTTGNSDWLNHEALVQNPNYLYTVSSCLPKAVLSC